MSDAEMRMRATICEDVWLSIPEYLHKSIIRAMLAAEAAAIEKAAKVSEEEPLAGIECMRAFRHEVGKSIATAIRSLK